MSDLSRRDLLQRLAAAFAGSAVLEPALAREAHALVAQGAGDASLARALSPNEYRTLERLTALIIPIDNGRPGALEAGVPRWIDALLGVNADLKAKYTNGLRWLDTAMQARTGRDFVSATADEQTSLLDVIAFKKNASPDVDAGIAFFTLARRMTVDGFYTSDAGIREIIPTGRPPLAEFVVPQAAVDYVISRSPFK